MTKGLRCGVALLAALVLAACGSAGGSGGGTAQLWVTRDQGASVVLTATVPAGLTVLQALDREADIKTRYGGRFVQSIQGIQGSLAAERDWFYFLNGIEPDVGAAEVTLHAGDIAWWDYRSWRQDQVQSVVVGAFPKPLTDGFDGKRRPIRVEAPDDPELQKAAAGLAQLLGRGGGAGAPNVFCLVVLLGQNAQGAELTATRGTANDSPVTFVLAGSRAAVLAASRALVRDPAVVRYRYEAHFDDQGEVVR